MSDEIGLSCRYFDTLNIQLQGSGNKQLKNVANIFIFEDKLRPFICKLQMWLHQIKALVDDKKCDASESNIKENIKTHLQIFIDEFNRIFPIILKKLKLIKN